MTESRSASIGGIFISYRRQDTAWQAVALYHRLAERFGVEHIFKDIDNIRLGENFVAKITNEVESCDILLALIGNNWLDITYEDGSRRLDDPNDFVRLEIEAALKRDVLLIPILVDGATMPPAEKLPANLTGLVHRQALELSPNRFQGDTDHLLAELASKLNDLEQRSNAADAEPEPQPEAEPEPGPEPAGEAEEQSPVRWAAVVTLAGAAAQTSAGFGALPVTFFALAAVLAASASFNSARKALVLSNALMALGAVSTCLTGNSWVFGTMWTLTQVMALCGTLLVSRTSRLLSRELSWILIALACANVGFYATNFSFVTAVTALVPIPSVLCGLLAGRALMSNLARSYSRIGLAVVSVCGAGVVLSAYIASRDVTPALVAAVALAVGTYLVLLGRVSSETGVSEETRRLIRWAGAIVAAECGQSLVYWFDYLSSVPRQTQFLPAPTFVMYALGGVSATVGVARGSAGALNASVLLVAFGQLGTLFGTKPFDLANSPLLLMGEVQWVCGVFLLTASRFGREICLVLPIFATIELLIFASFDGYSLAWIVWIAVPSVISLCLALAGLVRGGRDRYSFIGLALLASWCLSDAVGGALHTAQGNIVWTAVAVFAFTASWIALMSKRAS